jgi:hypothetical protein
MAAVKCRLLVPPAIMFTSSTNRLFMGVSLQLIRFNELRSIPRALPWPWPLRDQASPLELFHRLIAVSLW